MTEEGKAEVEHWNPEVLENRVFMLIPVFFNDASNMDREASHRLKEFIERSAKKIPAEGFPKGLAEKFPQMSVAKSQQFWADLDGDATEDFHPFIQQIASIPKDGHSKDMRFAYPLQMAQEDLISQIKGGKPRRFQMKLGKAASKRCGKDAVSLQFRTPSLYGFSSGIAILVLEWHYLSNNQSPVRASEVIEGNFAISHPPRGKRKASASVESEVGEVSIEVDDFVVLTHAVLPPDLADRLSASRRILYTALRVAPNDDEGADNDLALLVHRLAHRQTFDYMPDPSRVSAGQLCPFANVRHAASIEGGCTLVQAGAEAPDALQGFINDRLRNTYLPLALVNFHAYFWLISQTQVLPASSVSANAHVEKEELECLQERVLNFRRVFYFPVASQISRHNEFHALWQQALQIDRQLDALSELSAAVAAKVHDRRVRLFAYISGGIGGFLVGKELIEAFRDTATMNLYGWQQKLLLAFMNRDAEVMSEIQKAVHVAETWEWIVLLGAIICGVVGALVTWRYGLKRGKE